MNLVVLSKDEGQWLARNVIKTKYILDVQSKNDPQVLERRTYKTLAKIAFKAQKLQDAIDAFGDEQYELEITLDRKEKLEIKSLLTNTIKILETVIIPEYERKAKTDYKNDTIKKVAILKTLTRKMA